MATSNPAFAGQADDADADIDIEAGLKDGSITAEEGVVLMQERMKKLEAKIVERVEARLGGGGGQTAPPAEVAIRAVVARLTEAPSNWHQGVVFGLVTNDVADAELRMWAPLGYAVGGIIVFMQSAVACGLITSTFGPSCASSDQCGAGTYCRADLSRCEFCGYGIPLGMQYINGTCTWDGCMTYNRPRDPNFAGFNVAGIRAVCADPSLSTVTGHQSLSGNILAWCDVWCEIMSPIKLFFIYRALTPATVCAQLLFANR